MCPNGCDGVGFAAGVTISAFPGLFCAQIMHFWQNIYAVYSMVSQCAFISIHITPFDTWSKPWIKWEMYGRQAVGRDVLSIGPNQISSSQPEEDNLWCSYGVANFLRSFKDTGIVTTGSSEIWGIKRMGAATAACFSTTSAAAFPRETGSFCVCLKYVPNICTQRWLMVRG